MIRRELQQIDIDKGEHEIEWI